MAFNRIQIAALVGALWLDRAARKSALLSGLGKAAKSRFRVGNQHPQHAVQVPVIESVPGALQLFVIRKNLLGAPNIARSSFQFDGILAQVNISVEAVLENVQVFVASAEEGFDVGADLNTLSHSDLSDYLGRKRAILLPGH